MMLAIPAQVGPSQYDLFLVLQKDGLERIQRYDPANVDITELPPPWNMMSVRTVHICYATEEECMSFSKKTTQEIWEVLSRGWEFRPDLGDHDRGPERIEDFIKRRN